ncbi:hypothetical protein ROLI_006480 [Roseobacter fucihabitans]|uniref:Uncharacterized protein n=1 Tax=Roseobacter fucihabitans TaxID=1537242 RepID=A0ABZ2BQS3_9RHOB|nr:hypothetical protein [Roseobacter litoralis]
MTCAKSAVVRVAVVWGQEIAPRSSTIDKNGGCQDLCMRRLHATLAPETSAKGAGMDNRFSGFCDGFRHG